MDQKNEKKKKKLVKGFIGAIIGSFTGFFSITIFREFLLYLPIRMLDFGVIMGIIGCVAGLFLGIKGGKTGKWLLIIILIIGIFSLVFLFLPHW